MDFISLLVDQGIAISAALYVTGMIIKKIPHIPNWSIPGILTVLGILAAVFSMDGGFTVHNICQGIFAAGAAVLTNQTIKQVKNCKCPEQTEKSGK